MMRYLILVLITFLFISVSKKTSAQLWLGGRLGGTSASITGIGLKSFEPTPKMYLNGGLASSFSFSKRFSLGLELLYSGKGSAIQYTGDYNNMTGTINFEQRLHYFAIPMLLQFKMGDRDNFFHFDAGIVSNTLIGSKFKGTIVVQETNGDINTYPMDLKFSPLKSDFSYAFGIGLMANGITFDFRYEVGLNEIYVSESVDAPKIYNRAFLVSVGYMFNLL